MQILELHLSPSPIHFCSFHLGRSLMKVVQQLILPSHMAARSGHLTVMLIKCRIQLFCGFKFFSSPLSFICLPKLFQLLHSNLLFLITMADDHSSRACPFSLIHNALWSCRGWRCFLCAARYERIRELDLHLKTGHTALYRAYEEKSVAPRTCPICMREEERGRSSTFLWFFVTVKSLLFSLSSTERRFDSLTDLMVHYERNHGLQTRDIEVKLQRSEIRLR
jgi:hypothetical protein